MMHKEIINKKRVPIIYMALVSITIILYILKFIEKLKLNNSIIGQGAIIVLCVLAFFMAIAEIQSCRKSYKYSLIADELIINSVINRKENNLESIRTSDILYIGCRADMPKQYKNIFKSKHYSCNLFGAKSYYCVYKKDNDIKKLKFQPSDKLINKLSIFNK